MNKFLPFLLIIFAIGVQAASPRGVTYDPTNTNVVQTVHQKFHSITNLAATASAPAGYDANKKLGAFTSAQMRTFLGTGTQSGSTFLRGDGTWAVPAGGGGGSGDVVGPASSVDYSIAVYDGATGKLLRVVTGLVTDASGNLTVPGTITATIASFGSVVITNGGQYPISGSTVGLSSDDTYSGLPLTGMNAGETVAQWELVRVHSDGEWHLADADAAGEGQAMGLAVAAGTDGNAMTVLMRGAVRNDAWAWTVGGVIYLSATAGALTQTAPSTATHVVQKVGYALTADIIWFDPDSTTLVAQ